MIPRYKKRKLIKVKPQTFIILNIPCSTQEHLSYLASWGATTISKLSFDPLDYHIKNIEHDYSGGGH